MDNDLIIVSKDSDVPDLSLLLGNPPKVIWILLGKLFDLPSLKLHTSLV